MIISCWIFQQPIEQCKQKVRFDEAKMNELYSMSVALTMMDHIKANVFENEIAKELFNLKIVAKIICYCENMICSLWPRCKGHLVSWFIVFSWCYIIFCTYTSSDETQDCDGVTAFCSFISEL